MLEFVRTHRRLMFLVLLILVFPSFVFFGVQSYSSFMDSSHDAAKVDGKVITTAEVDNRVREQTDRLRQTSIRRFDGRTAFVGLSYRFGTFGGGRGPRGPGGPGFGPPGGGMGPR